MQYIIIMMPYNAIMQYNAIYNHNDAICNIYWKRMQYIAIIMQWKHFHFTVSQSTTSHRCEQCKMFVTFNFRFRLHSYSTRGHYFPEQTGCDRNTSAYKFICKYYLRMYVFVQNCKYLMHPHVFFKHTILHDCHCFSLRLKLVWYCSTRVRYCNVLKTTSWHYCILSTFLFVCSLSLFMLLGILLGPKYGSSVTQNLSMVKMW